MKDLIKEVALKVANTPRFNDIGEATLEDFARVFLTELSKRAEAVAKVQKHTGSLKDMAIIVWTNEQPPEGTKLFTFPPIHDIEAITQQYTYAKDIAIHLWEKHYKQDSPNWVPCDDLLGILTQIDNMIYGLQRPEAIENRVAEAYAKLADITDLQSFTAEDIRSGKWREHL